MTLSYFFLFCFFSYTVSFKLTVHPIEKRIAYITGIKNIHSISDEFLVSIKKIFQKHPMLIFKGIENVSPKEFIHFCKQFDDECDEIALENPDETDIQMLQPFDQFPDCKHVAPRGNIQLYNFYNISNITIKPNKAFINNYVWHTDILGHPTKHPNVITGFYIVKQPLIGGDTDFISGETIYENLSRKEQLAAQNMLIQINRHKMISHSIQTDYAGVSRLEDFEPRNDGNTQIPLVYAPDNNNAFEKPAILLMPSFFECVVGWPIKDSRKWIKKFMLNKVLPHRISIQWKKDDLAVFNNRKFIHSSTPARNYLNNEDSSIRLLLQTFIPTNKPLLGIKPDEKNIKACYDVGWIGNKHLAINSAYEYIRYADNLIEKYCDTPKENNFYTLRKKLYT